LIFLDSISFLSHGKLSLPLERYVLIDIDDIFVGEKGTRMKKSDVNELIESQRRLSLLIPGFRFNLGFSGKYYHKGNPEEDNGDDLLLGIIQ
jgi:heparan sulfate N-deacetylase/N-sulfotransferase NDST2